MFWNRLTLILNYATNIWKKTVYRYSILLHKLFLCVCLQYLFLPLGDSARIYCTLWAFKLSRDPLCDMFMTFENEWNFTHSEAWPLYAVNFLYSYISAVIHQNVCWIQQLFQQPWLWFILRSQAWAWLSESLLIQDCSSVRLGEKLGIHTRWASEGIVGSSPYRILKLNSSQGICFLVNTWNHTLKSVRNWHNRVTLIAK